MVKEKKVPELQKNPRRDERKAALPQRLARLKVWQLVILLIVMVGGGVLFIGSMAGWFDSKKVVVDEEMFCETECDKYLVDIDASSYEELVKGRKSFILLIDQNGCDTADRVRGFIGDYAKEHGMKVYRMMFGDMKETALHDKVKYYPSVVLVSKGVSMVWLKADENNDSDKYNNYETFREWIDSNIEYGKKGQN